MAILWTLPIVALAAVSQPAAILLLGGLACRLLVGVEVRVVRRKLWS
jgi:hypothetical protein